MEISNPLLFLILLAIPFASAVMLIVVVMSKYRVGVTKCPDCLRGTMGGGEELPLVRTRDREFGG